MTQLTKDSVFTLETSQIRALILCRENYIELADHAKLFVTGKLMTDEEQTAVSNTDLEFLRPSVGIPDSFLPSTDSAGTFFLSN